MANDRIISHSGKRHHPRVSLHLKCWVEDVQHGLKDISAGGLACFKPEQPPVYPEDRPLDVKLAFEVEGVHVLMQTRARIVEDAGQVLHLAFDEDSAGETREMLEYLIDAYLTGEAQKARQVVAGLLGLKEAEMQQAHEKRAFSLSMAFSIALILSALYLIYSSLTDVEIIHTTVSQRLYTVKAPSEGLIFPLVDEGQKVNKGDLLFIIKGKSQSVALANIYSRMSTLNERIKLKQREMEEAQTILDTHLQRLQETEASLKRQIAIYREELANREKLHQAYQQAAREGLLSQKDYLDTYNKLLTLRRILLRKENELKNIRQDIRNARQGIYSINGVIKENFPSPHKIRREIALLRAEARSLKKSLTKIIRLEGIKIYAGQSGILKKILVEYGNGVTDGQNLAYISPLQAEKIIIAIIRASDTGKIRQGQRVTVTIGDEAVRGEVVEIQKSYQNIDISSNEQSLYYGLKDFESYEYSFVFIKIPDEYLEKLPLGARPEVTIHAL